MIVWRVTGAEGIIDQCTHAGFFPTKAAATAAARKCCKDNGEPFSAIEIDKISVTSRADLADALNNAMGWG